MNACKGCGKLPHEPGAACSNGGIGICDKPGVYICDGEEATKCNAPPPMPGTEDCDDIDDDCDGTVDEGVLNACGACGEVPAETCDGVDDDRDGQVDEGVMKTWYEDCDGDGFGKLENSVESCFTPTLRAGCRAYVELTPVAGSTLDCRDDSVVYRPTSHGWYLDGYTAGGSGPWTEPPLQYDFNCDGVVELASRVFNSRDLPLCSNGCGPHDCVTPMNPPTGTSACGGTSTGNLYRTGSSCSSPTAGWTTFRILCK